MLLDDLSAAVIGCQTPAKVAENAKLARSFVPFGEQTTRRLELVTRAAA